MSNVSLLVCRRTLGLDLRACKFSSISDVLLYLWESWACAMNHKFTFWADYHVGDWPLADSHAFFLCSSLTFVSQTNVTPSKHLSIPQRKHASSSNTHTHTHALTKQAAQIWDREWEQRGWHTLFNSLWPGTQLTALLAKFSVAPLYQLLSNKSLSLHRKNLSIINNVVWAWDFCLVLITVVQMCSLFQVHRSQSSGGKVKTDKLTSSEKPRQLFWEKRLAGLRPSYPVRVCLIRKFLGEAGCLILTLLKFQVNTNFKFYLDPKLFS
jgi:hypothetical protein